MRLQALVAALYFACVSAQDDSSVSASASESSSNNDDNSSSESDSSSTSESASASDDSSSSESKDSSDSSTDSSSDNSSTESKSDDSSSSTESNSDDSSSSTDSNSDSSSESKTDESSSESSSSTPTSVSINPVMPPGSLEFKTPVTTESLYVKVGDYQTFSWNYTNLQVTPSAVNIDLVCAMNSHTFTLATNKSIDDTQFVWNSSDTNENDPDQYHLLLGTYTMRIYNSSGSPDDSATAGYLQPVSYVFGVYTPENYKSWANAGKYVNMGSLPGISAAAATILFTCIALFI